MDIPFKGFGAAGLGNLGREVSEDAAEAVLASAWAEGFRYFDTSPWYGYGLSELRLGRFLRQKPRADYLLSTKVGRYFTAANGRPIEPNLWVNAVQMKPVVDYTYEGTLRALDQSYARTGIDRFDIVYIHDLDRRNQGAEFERHYDTALNGAFRALSELRQAGHVHAIGLGVNESDVAANFIRDAEIDVVMLAGRYTLLEQGAQDDALPTALKRNVSIISGGVFNSGILATGPRPGAIYDYAPASEGIIKRVRDIEAICAAHRVPLARAAAQFPHRHPAIGSVVIGLTDPERVRQSTELLHDPIPAALWSDLESAGLVRPL